MKSQMLDHARRPTPLRARQKTALSATERDCFASHQKPKRSAVRGCASPGCCARHRWPPTAINKRSRDRMPPPFAAHCGIEMSHHTKCPRSSIFRLHALPLSLLRKILSRNSTAFQPSLRHIRAINPPQFSHHAAKNSLRFRQQCVIHPPRFGHVRNVSVAFHGLIRFSIRGQFAISIHPRSGRGVGHYVQLFAFPMDYPTVCVLRVRPLSKKHLALAQSRVGCLLEDLPFAAASKRHRVFLFASRVVFRASSNGRPNLCCRVVLSGVAGRVSGLMSSRAGRAHRDCLPLFTAPKQSHGACFAVLRGFPSFCGRSFACFVQQLSLIRISSRVHARTYHGPEAEPSKIEME